MRDYLLRQLQKAVGRSEEAKAPTAQTAVERVKKTALNTLVRFDIDAMGFDNSSLSMYEELRKKGVGQDEEEFTDVLYSGPTITKYAWEDRYKPRKPRFFNTVQTGYEWNKYNQTHYDLDNPPPKTV